MKAENITKARQTCDLLRSDLRELHREAIASEPFAEVLALDLISDVAALQLKLNRFAEAARIKGDA